MLSAGDGWGGRRKTGALADVGRIASQRDKIRESDEFAQRDSSQNDQQLSATAEPVTAESGEVTEDNVESASLDNWEDDSEIADVEAGVAVGVDAKVINSNGSSESPPSVLENSLTGLEIDGTNGTNGHTSNATPPPPDPATVKWSYYDDSKNLQGTSLSQYRSLRVSNAEYRSLHPRSTQIVELIWLATSQSDLAPHSIRHRCLPAIRMASYGRKTRNQGRGNVPYLACTHCLGGGPSPPGGTAKGRAQTSLDTFGTCKLRRTVGHRFTCEKCLCCYYLRQCTKVEQYRLALWLQKQASCERRRPKLNFQPFVSRTYAIPTWDHGRVLHQQSGEYEC